MFAPARRPRQRILGTTDSRAPLPRTVHGLKPAEPDALFRLQGGRCAICQRSGVRLVIDHDHRHHPGRSGCRRCVRGLLCTRCNTAIGQLGEANVDRLVKYLR